MPEGAKILKRKDGPVAKYRNAKGKLIEAKLTKSGAKVLLEQTHYFIQFSDNRQITRKLKAYTDKKSSDRLADKVQELLNLQGRPLRNELSNWVKNLRSDIRAELHALGLVSQTVVDAGRSLDEYLEDFRKHMASKERDPKNIKAVTGTLKAVFADCGFQTWSDIDPRVLKACLDDRRDSGKGISKRRYNGILGSVKFFCRVIAKQRGERHTPVDLMDGMDNPQTDSRHPRRPLSVDDFRRFVEAAQAGPYIYCMTGYERSLVYRFALETGLRSIDIRRLRVGDFNFAERKITIEASRIKNKTESIVYLKPAMAAEVQQYCARKLPDAQVFHLTDKTAKMVRFDLKNTDPEIPYIENGKYFDFHSIRHTSASLLGMNPDTPEAVRQKVMRHKTPEMTRHYTHTDEEQEREAINALPDMTLPSTQALEAVKTGTESLSKSCFTRGQLNTNMNKYSKVSGDNTRKTAFPANKQGFVQTTEPKVWGSNPYKRVFFL